MAYETYYLKSISSNYIFLFYLSLKTLSLLPIIIVKDLLNTYCLVIFKFNFTSNRKEQ